MMHFKIEMYWESIDEWVGYDEISIERRAYHAYEATIKRFPDIPCRLRDQWASGGESLIIKEHKP